jgi:diguanylate cyclase (GGDEF)-like protein
VRGLFTACLLGSMATGLSATCGAAESDFDVQVLSASVIHPTASAVVSGSLDAYFEPPANSKAGRFGGDYWLKIQPRGTVPPGEIPVAVMHAPRQTHAQLYAEGDAGAIALPLDTRLPGFSGTQDTVYTRVEGLKADQPLYAHVDARSGDARLVGFSSSTLDTMLALGTEHTRMIALSFGALMAVSLAALLIWFVLSDLLFIFYAAVFFLQALYVVFLSGQGFDWPGLSYALPLGSFAWNVPVGLSGAAACLFTREIADLRASSPRVYAAFGWFAAAFLVVTVGNVAKLWGLSVWVSAVGNLVFLVSAVFTIAVAFLAWRRGNRAAGWFLIAWLLLEGFTMTAALRFLFSASHEPAQFLYYYGLPLSMVAASILIALGVADRLRQQRAALSDAERRAQTDPLTGVLNRRSLIERLEAACARARARGLPIALLFLDLDHFKDINDSHGHQAGDACLRAIIEPIHAELRQSDVIGRYGGEEFVVVLSSADAAAAHPIAQRILERIAAVRVDGFGNPIRLTCSIGIAASDTLGVWGEHLIAQADAAVYLAKRLGRNQVQMAVPLAA